MNEMTRAIEEVKESVKTENWRQRIQECQQSGKSVQTWCKENGIAASTYYRYLRKIRETLLQDNPGVEAIYCFSDFIALKVYRILRKKK